MQIKLNTTQTESVAVLILTNIMTSSQPSNVTTRDVQIDWTKNPQINSDPAPSNLCNGGKGAPFHDAYPPIRQKTVSNACAAKFVFNNEMVDTNRETFRNYHNACVKVIAAKQGSGILFQISKIPIMLVTSGHVINDGTSNVKIVLEINHKRVANTSATNATEVTIELQNQQTKIVKEEDIAEIILGEDDSKYILNKVHKFPCPSLALNDQSSDEFMTIHYSGGKFKKVSTGKREKISGNYQPLQTRIHIQAGEGASGAPLFNCHGDVVAIIRSRTNSYPQIRNVTPVESSPYCYGYGLCDGLETLFESTEGKKFDEQLELHDEDIDATVLHCLGMGGKHGDTKQYSKVDKIDSDHFPPYDAYNQACQEKNCCARVKSFFSTQYQKVRPGENLLPAITIPKVIHKKIKTTGSSLESKQFRKEQAQRIASNQVCDAITMNFNEYHEKGLFKRSTYECTEENFETLMSKFNQGFNKALEEHKKLRFISNEEKNDLENAISQLCFAAIGVQSRQSESDGESH